MHKVQPGETAVSIAQKYGLQGEGNTLEDRNPHVKVWRIHGTADYTSNLQPGMLLSVANLPRI